MDVLAVVTRGHTLIKNYASSRTPGFCALRCAYAIITKEERDTAATDLLAFFLQTKMEGDERVLLKLTLSLVAHVSL